ncbi:MAG: phosphate-starvation-inducible PsiE family protein [Nitrospinota bacterium]
MIQVTYISSVTRPITQMDLEEILSKSRKNNIELGVTGMLLFGNNTFVQTLEGEEKRVNELINKIRKDPRHKDFKLVSKKEIGKRQYLDWTMGFKKLDENDFNTIKGIDNFKADKFNTTYLENHTNILEILLEHYRVEQSKRQKHEELSLDEEDNLLSILHRIIRSSVKLLSILMVMIILWGIADVIYTVYNNLFIPAFTTLTINHIVSTFGAFLAVLIAIEIFINITLYIRKDIIHIKLVIATALMAIARKVIIFDFKQITPAYIYGTASVILALGLTYWLIEKNTKENSEDGF